MRVIKRALIALVLSAGVASPAMAQGSGKWVTGYYGAWFWDVPDYQAPQHVDMTQMTHFVFGRIAPGGGDRSGGLPGEVVPGAGTAQNNRLVGPGAPTRTVEQYMIDRAHQVGTKALVMLGGDGDNTGFRRSTEPAVRALFVKRLVDYLVARDYDGIDVDWEGIASNDTDSQQRLENLIADLRAEAATRTRYQDGKPFLITYPAGMINLNIDHVLSHHVRLGQLVDQFNLMSYGMGWFGSGWHSTVFAPLTGNTPQRPMDIKSTIQKYVDAGIPRTKIGMGIGFYGMNYKPTFTQPGQSTDGYPMSHWSVNDVHWNYAMLHKHGYLSNGTYIYDSATQTSYRTYPGGYYPANRTESGYLSYEDPASIAAKGAFALSTREGEGAAGTIVWMVNYGTTDGVNNPLMHAVKKAFLDPNAEEPGPNPNPDPNPPPPINITTALNITNDWTSGYCANLVATNAGGTAAEWSATIPFKDAITSLWNGEYTRGADTLTVKGPGWDKYLEPGESHTIGLCANRPAPPTAPPTEPGQVTAAVTVSNDWGAGYCASVVVSNGGATAAVNWTASVTIQGQVTSLWSGKYVQTGSTLQLSGPDWKKDLPANSTYNGIGFCASR
jgi:GH18 family chitinase